MPKITHYKVVKADGVVLIRYQCVGCGKQQETPVSKAGSRAQCFACGNELDVPSVQEMRDRASGKAEPPTVEVPVPPPMPSLPPPPSPTPTTPVGPPSPGWAEVVAAIREQTKQDAEFYDRTSWRLFYIVLPFWASFIMGLIALLGLLLGGLDELVREFRG